MSDLATILFPSALWLALVIVSTVLMGVASFLYNDGRDHEVAGGLSTLASMGAAMAGMLDGEDDDGRYAEGLFGLFEFVWDVLGDFVLEFSLAGMAGLIGLGAAMLTRTTPSDGRRPRVRPDLQD